MSIPISKYKHLATDDDWSNAINVANEECTSQGHDLLFEKGIYPAYDLRPTCNWTGEGSHDVYIRNNRPHESRPEAQLDFVRIGVSSDITISNIVFDGNCEQLSDPAADLRTGLSNGAICLVVRSGGSSRVVIEKCVFENSGRGPGLLLESIKGTGGVLIDQCRTRRTRGSAGDGIQIKNCVGGVLVRDCHVVDYTRGGFVCEPAIGVNFLRCNAGFGTEVLQGTPAAFYWEKASHISAEDCRVDGEENQVVGFKIVCGELTDEEQANNLGFPQFPVPRKFELRNCQVARVQGFEYLFHAQGYRTDVTLSGTTPVHFQDAADSGEVQIDWRNQREVLLSLSGQ